MTRAVVAEDDPSILAVVAEELERLGIQVDRADNGADLIDLVANGGPFDLIVTDISMPWMSGLQVARSARNAGSNTPILVMTALKGDKFIEQARTLGENVVVLHKPFDLDQLDATVKALLKKTA